MAWEEESIDTGADFEEVGGKRNPIKLILIAVVLLAVVAGGWFAYKHFTKEEVAEGEKPESTKGEKVEEVVEEVIPDAGFKVDLEKFTLNLADTGKPHYLVVKISLEVTPETLKTSLETDDKLYQTKTRDLILNVLRGKTMKEVNDAATMKEITKEIQHKLNRIYGDDGKVMNVYYTEFMVQ